MSVLTCHFLWKVSAVWQSDPKLSGTCPFLLTLNHTYSFTLLPWGQVCLTTFAVTERERVLTDKQACCSLTIIGSNIPCMDAEVMRIAIPKRNFSRRRFESTHVENEGFGQPLSHSLPVTVSWMSNPRARLPHLQLQHTPAILGAEAYTHCPRSSLQYSCRGHHQDRQFPKR